MSASRRRLHRRRALALVLLGGCALFTNPDSVAPGTPAAAVVQQLGRPTAQYPASANAGERLQYTYQPAGQRVYNVDLDAQGRVARVEQALSEAPVPASASSRMCGRALTCCANYGSPARTMGVHKFQGDVWVWRYLDGPIWRLLYIDIDRAGVVRGWSNGDEDLPDPPDPR